MTQRGGGSDAPFQATAVHLVVLSQTSPRTHGYPSRMVNMEARVIVLAWPPRDLHPNSRPHYHAKAKAAKAYREAAYWLTEQAMGRATYQHPLVLDIEFYPPDKRRRDLDGMLSAIKSGLDGIADALKVDDSEFGLSLSRGQPVKGGRVVVTLS